MKIYKLTRNQLKKLQAGETISVNGVQYTYEDSAVYLPIDGESTYTLRNDDYIVQLYKDNAVISEIEISNVPHAVKADNANQIVNPQGDETMNYSYLKDKFDSIPTKVSQLTNDKNFTSNTGTITGIKMNGTSKGTSGVIDLGTVITAHQDISGKQDKLSTAQLNAVNSGITSDKIKTYDGYNSTISGHTTRITALEGKPGLDKVGTVVKVNNTTPDASGNVSITIPPAVSEATVSGWGFTKNTGTYSKPSGGIPKTDLASAVQTSLGKADSAVQKVKINGEEKSPTDGTADLGNILPNIVLTTNTGMFASSMAFTQATGNEIFTAITKLGLKVGSHFMLNDGTSNWATATIYSLSSTSCTFRALLTDAAHIRQYNFTVNNGSSGNSISFVYIHPAVDSYDANTTAPVSGKTIYSDLAKKVNTSTTIAGKALSSNISAADLRTALNVENGANKTTVDSVWDASSSNPISNNLVYNNFAGVQLTCDLDKLWSLNTECELSGDTLTYAHTIHHSKLTSGIPSQSYLFDTRANIYIFDGANETTDKGGFAYLFHTTRYENGTPITYNLTIWEDNTAMLTKADNGSSSETVLSFEVDADIFNGGIPSADNGIKLFNWVQTNNLHKTFANFNLTYQQRVGSFFVGSYSQTGDDTYSEFILVGGGYGNRNRGLVEMILTVNPSTTPNLANNYFAYTTELPNTNGFVKTTGTQTINGTKTFSGDVVFNNSLKGQGDSAYIQLNSSAGQDATTLEIYPNGVFGFLFADRDCGEYFRLPYITNPDYDKDDPATLATTGDVVGIYSYSKRTNMTSSSYSTDWSNTMSVKNNDLVIIQISSGSYSTTADSMLNKSVFIWKVPSNWTSASNVPIYFATETTKSTSATSFSIDGAVSLTIVYTAASKTQYTIRGRSADSTPGKIEYWIYSR